VLNKNVINFINELFFVGKTAAVLVSIQEREGVDYMPRLGLLLGLLGGG